MQDESWCVVRGGPGRRGLHRRSHGEEGAHTRSGLFGVMPGDRPRGDGADGSSPTLAGVHDSLPPLRNPYPTATPVTKAMNIVIIQIASAVHTRSMSHVLPNGSRTDEVYPTKLTAPNAAPQPGNPTVA